MIYKTIYHRDGLFGYTEPLGFEDLTSALEAYNSSQVDAGTLRATLVCKQDTVRKPSVLELVVEALAVYILFYQFCSLYSDEKWQNKKPIKYFSPQA